MSRAHPLADFIAYLEREAARRAKGGHPGVVRVRDTELEALLIVLRPEVRKEARP